MWNGQHPHDHKCQPYLIPAPDLSLGRAASMSMTSTSSSALVASNSYQFTADGLNGCVRFTRREVARPPPAFRASHLCFAHGGDLVSV